MASMTVWELYRVEFGWNGYFNEIFKREFIHDWMGSTRPTDEEIASVVREKDLPDYCIFDLAPTTVMG